MRVFVCQEAKADQRVGQAEGKRKQRLPNPAGHGALHPARLPGIARLDQQVKLFGEMAP